MSGRDTTTAFWLPYPIGIVESTSNDLPARMVSLSWIQGPNGNAWVWKVVSPGVPDA